jgi:hypothetical protein
MKKTLYIVLSLFAQKTDCMEQPETAKTVIQPPEQLERIALNRTGTRVLLRSASQKIFIADQEKIAPLDTKIFVPPLQDHAYGPIIAPNGEVVLAWDDEKLKTLLTIDCTTGKTIRRDSHPTASYFGLNFGPNNEILFTISEDKFGSLSICTLSNWIKYGFGALQKITSREQIEAPHYLFTQVHQVANLIAIFSQTRKLFTTIYENGVNRYTIRISKIKKKILDTEHISRVTWSNNRTIAAVGIFNSKKIIFCDYHTGSQAALTLPSLDTIHIGSFSPDGNLFALSMQSWGNEILIINCADLAHVSPVMVLTPPEGTQSVSRLDWPIDHLHVQFDVNKSYTYLCGTPEETVSSSKSSSDQTIEQAMQPAA